MATDKTTFPREFAALLRDGDFDAARAVLEPFPPGTRGPFGDHALAHTAASPDLLRWLVERGEDIEGVDKAGRTPLMVHAEAWNGKVPVLLELGADLTARDRRGRTALHFAAVAVPDRVRELLAGGADPTVSDARGLTPLAVGLNEFENGEIDDMAEAAELLLAAGDRATDEMRVRVGEVGERFEQWRDVFDEESLPAADAALHRLYEMFGVAAAATVERHDGTSPIAVPSGGIAEAFNALYDFLTPGMGAAETAQGEAVRIVGRANGELGGNGGVNWDRDYRRMVEFFPELMMRGAPLDEVDLKAIRTIVKTLRKARWTEDDIGALAEYAVEWIRRNPDPLPLGPIGYAR